MTGQQLPLALPSRRAPQAGPALADRLLALLVERQGWMKRKELAAHGFTSRACRCARQHSKGRVIAGQRGFRASQWATVEELERAANTLVSQAKIMQDEAKDVWRVLHGRASIRQDERKDGTV